MRAAILVLDILVCGVFYYLFLTSLEDKRNRPFILAGIILAFFALFLSPVFSPLRSIFGPALAIPLVWMLLRSFRNVPEYYWTSTFLAIWGIFSLLSGKYVPLGVLSLILSPLPLAVGGGLISKFLNYVRFPQEERNETEGEVETIEESEMEDKAEPPIATGEMKIETEKKSSDDDVESTKEAILSKLSEFGIKGDIVRVSKGPVLTIYEFVPAPGISVSSVVSREEDLYIALKKPVRIVAPMPNGNIGIEVPNRTRKVFTFDEALPHLKDGSSTEVPIGVDVLGRPYILRLEKAPHILVGGATGSGKSVLLSTIILGLIKKNTSETLRLVLIDPKMVELSTFEGIPHLLLPVAKTVPQAVYALRKVIEVMMERYATLSTFGAKDIETYNSKAKSLDLDPMPYIVVVVDELADLMIQARKDTVDTIQRIAQIARAVGIHMIVATQRPSVDVIKPVIKANFPARIALKVASRFDSRTILDRDGAEMLLGRGDMLVLMPDSSYAVRVHGYYTTQKHVRSALISWLSYRLSKEWGTKYPDTEKFVRRAFEEGVLTVLFRDDEIAFESRFERAAKIFGEVFGKEDSEEILMETLMGYYPYRYEEGGENDTSVGKLDPKILDAAEVLQEVGYGSVSLLQRRLGVGYPRAAKIVDQLERLGFLSKPQGSAKPRSILMSVEELKRKISRFSLE